MPGTSAREATAVVAGELPDLPHLPELPARGPGADLVGRTAALLSSVSSDLAVATTPTGWRFADAPGRDLRRAAAFWREDLDTVEEAFAGVRGPLKAQLAGPWTLAASIETRSGERALRDRGAVRELSAALAVAAAEHIADLRRRLPGARLLLCLDEPSIHAVRDGAVPTASGLGRLPAIADAELTESLGVVVDAVREAGALPMVHVCSARPPVAALVAAGAGALSIDLGVLARSVDDEVAAAVERGVGLLCGLVPTLADEAALRAEPVPAAVGRLSRWWSRMGFDDVALRRTVSISPACGLAGATPAGARAVLARTGAIARALRDESPDGERV